MKILLEIGSEVDIDAKLLCKCYNGQTSTKNIADYRCEILQAESDFSNTKVNIIQYCNIPSFQPWKNWNEGHRPVWWDEITFYQDVAFFVNPINGHLFYKTGIY